MEPAAEVIHGAEYRFPAYDRSHQELLQGHHAEIADRGIRIACHKQGQDLCFQVRHCPREMDKDITHARIEHLHGQPCLCKAVPDRLRLIAMSFRSNQRIASSRFMG